MKTLYLLVGIDEGRCARISFFLVVIKCMINLVYDGIMVMAANSRDYTSTQVIRNVESCKLHH